MEAQAEDRVYNQYFRDVSRIRMPANAAEERDLFQRYHREGDLKARALLVEGGLRFVVKTAKQYYHGNTEFLKSLIAAGNVGLMVAVDRYMPWVIKCHHCDNKNYVPQPKNQRCQVCNRALRQKDAELYTTRFLTYAAWWISEAIRTHLYNASLVHVPPYKQKEIHRERLAGKQAGFLYVPYDELTDEFQSSPVTAKLAKDITDSLTTLNARKIIYGVLRQMKDRYAYVVITYFGLREEPKTLREIAQKLGVCSERVRQIKVDALEDLRRRLLQRDISSALDLYN